TGRPSKPPRLFTSSFQICTASSAGLPLAESPPVSAIPKPILIGSAPRARNTPPLASTSAPTVAPIRAQLRIPHVPYRFIGSLSPRASHGARSSLSEASRRHVYGKPTGNATTNRSRVTAKTRPSRFSCAFRTDQAIWPVMVRWLGILIGTLRSTVRTHPGLALENLALRQQLAVWKARQPRPRLTAMDRIFWVFLSRLWTSWRSSLRMVRPETVVGWHRQGFRRYWAWKSRRRRGRPAIRTELRDLIRRISRA